MDIHSPQTCNIKSVRHLLDNRQFEEEEGENDKPVTKFIGIRMVPKAVNRDKTSLILYIDVSNQV